MPAPSSLLVPSSQETPIFCLLFRLHPDVPQQQWGCAAAVHEWATEETGEGDLPWRHGGRFCANGTCRIYIVFLSVAFSLLCISMAISYSLFVTARTAGVPIYHGLLHDLCVSYLSYVSYDRALHRPFQFFSPASHHCAKSFCSASNATPYPTALQGIVWPVVLVLVNFVAQADLSTRGKRWI